MVCCPRPQCRAERSPVHLAHRAYVLVLLTAVMAIAAIWSRGPGVADLWRIPAGLLLLGLALEGWLVRRVPVKARLATAPRAFLGRPHAAAFVFANASARPLAVEYAPAMPAGFEPLAQVRRVSAPAHATVHDPVTLLPVRLGPQAWPALPARVLGALRLAWGSCVFHPQQRLLGASDSLHAPVWP